MKKAKNGLAQHSSEGSQEVLFPFEREERFSKHLKPNTKKIQRRRHIGGKRKKNLGKIPKKLNRASSSDETDFRIRNVQKGNDHKQ